MTTGNRPAIHPGEVLGQLYLAPLDMSAEDLAARLLLPVATVESLLKDEMPIDAETALRLSRFVSTTPEFWINLQTDFDLKKARTGIESDLANIAPLHAA